jgi:hypothetical protein
MLERLLEQKQTVTAYASDHDIPTLAAYQWVLVENIIRVLKPFVEMTLDASAEHEKISYVIPAAATIVSYLSKRQKDSGVQTLKEELKKSVEKRLLNAQSTSGKRGHNVMIDMNYSVATFLDPRFMVRFLKDPDEVKKFILDKMKVQDGSEESSVEKKPEKSAGTVGSSVGDEAHVDFWECFAEIATTSQTDSEPSENETEANESAECQSTELSCPSSARKKKRLIENKKELDRYMSESLISRTENPINWWKLNRSKYPKLSELMLKYLSAPPSSVTSERLFSAASQVYTENRNKLSPDNAEKLIFIMKNAKLVKMQ